MSHVDHYRSLEEYSTPNGFITQNPINAHFLWVVLTRKFSQTTRDMKIITAQKSYENIVLCGFYDSC